MNAHQRRTEKRKKDPVVQARVEERLKREQDQRDLRKNSGRVK